MEKLHKIHSRCILLYIAIPACAVALSAFCAKFFHFLPPVQLVGVVICLTPLSCALARLRLWWDRNMLFSESELDSRPVQIFFRAIPVEIAFSLIAVGFIMFS